MFYQMPPVGNPVCLDGEIADESVLAECFSPYTPHFLDSGTAALAAAVLAAIRLKDIGAPEVILPAYGCPDLVSAVVHAGARPVLVDLEPERPWMDLKQVSASINSRTVAIVAAGLLGIPERMDDLGALAKAASVVLIEDSAQAFPRLDDGDFWRGDLIVLSFGRGKPVSLLGGGAVLYRDSRFAGLLPAGKLRTGGQRAVFRLQAAIYNLLLSPRLYWIPHRLPFLHLGETYYRPLAEISSMDGTRRAMLAANIRAYQARPLDGQAAVAQLVKNATAAGSGVIDLPVTCGLSQSRKLLRYPLLVGRGSRDSIYRCLLGKGQGGSVMYTAILPELPGLETLLADNGEFPAARDFASHLLTLPVYNRLQDADLTEIRGCFDACR